MGKHDAEASHVIAARQAKCLAAAKAARLRELELAVIEAAIDEANTHDSDLPYEYAELGCLCPLCEAIRAYKAEKGE